MPRYPHSFDNGAGERITFTRLGADDARLEGDTLVSPGAGPPMHVHFLQEEGFTVVEGRIGFQRGTRPPEFAGPGETVVFGAGEPHRFWNAGESDLRCTAWIAPAGNVEYFLAAVFDSQKRNGGHRPDILEVAFLTRRYRTEFAMLEIPALVQRVVFPVLVVVGRLLGRYARYADAPPPLVR
jgi:mannose-6-phosphate isomerase-like protein (cupin superfamily)